MSVPESPWAVAAILYGLGALATLLWVLWGAVRTSTERRPLHYLGDLVRVFVIAVAGATVWWLVLLAVAHDRWLHNQDAERSA